VVGSRDGRIGHGSVTLARTFVSMCTWYIVIHTHIGGRYHSTTDRSTSWWLAGSWCVHIALGTVETIHESCRGRDIPGMLGSRSYPCDPALLVPIVESELQENWYLFYSCR
jgi:hypothetical protein